MTLRDLPHFKVEASDLAQWLDVQGASSWWSVDGDPRLMGLISFPCLSEDLATLLRRFKEPLLVLDPKERPGSRGVHASFDEIDGLVYIEEESGNRLLRLGWAHSKHDSDWLLIEDKDIARMMQELENEETPSAV